MKSFSSRNPVPIAVVGLVLMALGFVVALNADDLPLIGAGTTYSADFTEAAGLKPDDEVRVAGVKVDKVTDVELDGAQVKVSFKVKDTWLGDKTAAAIKIKTLLGQKYLALDPVGDRTLDPGTTIPKERTLAPYDVIDAFRDLSSTVDQIDTGQLAQSFDAVADALKDTPQPLRDTLSGLSALSRTVSSRDQELANLLANTSQVSRTLADRNAQLTAIINDGNLLLGELQRRWNAIKALLTGTQQLAVQLSGLVADNRAQLRPTLERLGEVTTILQNNQDNLNRSLELLAPFTRVGANATGNGRWFEGYICGLLPPVIKAGGLSINPEGCTPPISAPDQGVGNR